MKGTRHVSDVISIRERFGLRRDNFILDPVTDTDCFARDDIDTHLLAESLDIDLVTKIAPKRLVWGPYGAGKTHTLMRTMRELEQLTPIHPVRIECPDLSKKSRFHDLYREGIMRQLGQDFIIGLIEEAIHSVGLHRRDEMVQRLKERFQDEEVAKAAIRVINPNFDVLVLWRWISGVPMSRADLDELGQTQDLTQTEAARLAEFLCLFGRLERELHGKTLVLVLDEMERLRSIGAETITTFVSGFTRLVDPNQNAVSVLIGASAQQQAEMVEVFSPNGPVVSRLGNEAQVEISSLDDADVNKFIKEVIAFVREPSADIQSLIDEASSSVTETVNDDFFPFTEEAVDALKSKLTQFMTPREITITMTRSLGRAHRVGGLVVTTESIA
jgi:hypothetical protein